MQIYEWHANTTDILFARELFVMRYSHTMFNYIINFFRPELLFNMRPGTLEGTGLHILLWFFSIMILLGAITSFIMHAKKEDKILTRAIKKFRMLFFTMGVIGFIYTFFAYEGATFLGARFWVIILALTFLFWIFFPIKYVMIEVPKIKEDVRNRKEFEKYLP